MKKYLVFVLILIMAIGVAGCSGKEEDKGAKTTAGSIESSSNVEESISSDDLNEESSRVETTVKEETIESEEVTTLDESEEKTTAAEQETTTKAQQTEKPVEATTKKPAETTTKKPAETTTKKPEETEAPIVTKIGSVDNTQYNKAVKAFESIVKKMRQDGIVKKTDVCVTMEGNDIKVDINYGDKDSDLILKYDAANKIYELVVDYEFCWLSELALTINGKDSASYNKELFKALLSMVTSEVDIVFYRIDLDCFSDMGIYVDRWIQVGDCSLMGGEFQLDKFFTYYLTTEDVDSRDKTFTLIGKNSAGKTVECVIEYDSNVVKFEATDTGAYMEGNSENNIFGYPTLKTGSSSYENYKKALVDSWKAKGDPNAFATEMTSHSMNGYTYYWFELFYETADAKGNPEVLYVQIGANEYLELYNFESWIRLEDFVNGALFIKEVIIK